MVQGKVFIIQHQQKKLPVKKGGDFQNVLNKTKLTKHSMLHDRFLLIRQVLPYPLRQASLILKQPS